MLLGGVIAWHFDVLGRLDLGRCRVAICRLDLCPDFVLPIVFYAHRSNLFEDRLCLFELLEGEFLLFVGGSGELLAVELSFD